MNRREFMEQVLGADRPTMMTVLNKIVDMVDMSFTPEERQQMWRLLLDPDAKLEVATLLADTAEKAGMFE